MTGNTGAPSSFWSGGPGVTATISQTPPYLVYGALPAAPATDPLGGAIVSGAFYYDTTQNGQYTFNGTSWVGSYPGFLPTLQSLGQFSYNLSIGYGSLGSLQSGVENTGFGWHTLGNCTTGGFNSAFGVNALGGYLTTGSNNAAFGVDAGRNIGTGSFNAFFGAGAGTGSGSTNTTASHNAVCGNQAAFALTSGTNNSLLGDTVATNLTTGAGNTIIGPSLAPTLTTGNNNIIIGTTLWSLDVAASNTSSTLNIGGVLQANGTDGPANFVSPAGGAFSRNVDFNTSGDTGMFITLPTGYTRFQINSVVLSGASHSLTTATCGLFTAASGGGVAIVTGGSTITLSATANATNHNSQALTVNNSGTLTYNSASNLILFFNIANPEGTAATATVTILYTPLP